jgi:DNA-binding transcriptional ArsR family regulator
MTLKRALSIDDDEAAELAEMFRLMGDASRLKIVALCLSKPRCVSDIALKARLSQSLVSHHLRLLRAARMLRAERRGKQVFYVAADDHVRSVIADMIAHISEAPDDLG